MQAIKDVIFYLLLEFALLFFEFFLYYEKGRPIIPLLIGGGIALIVLVIGVAALFESIKHRNDKEPW